MILIWRRSGGKPAYYLYTQVVPKFGRKSKATRFSDQELVHRIIGQLRLMLPGVEFGSITEDQRIERRLHESFLDTRQQSLLAEEV